MEAELDQKEYIVIDNGSGYIKAGFSGEDAPRVILPTIYGVREAQEAGRPNTILFGNQINLKDPNCSMDFPVQRGAIGNRDVDWDHMRQIWEYIISEELQQEPTQANILITDAPLNSRENRLQIAQQFFERIGVSSLGIMPQSSLSLFSTGRTRGMVVEMGDGLTSIVPVFEGYGLPHAVKKMPVAGTDITSYMLKGIQQLKPTQFDVARLIKEKMVIIPFDYDQAMQSPKDIATKEEKSYELPSGEIIKVQRQLRLEAAEILFNPSIVDSDSASITQLICESILKCDNDLRNDMYSNIVLSGGSSMLRGLHNRIEKEVRETLPNDIPKQDIRIISDSFRQYGAWIGGSMLASLSTFDQYMVMKKSVWDDEGTIKPSLVHKYTFQNKRFINMEIQEISLPNIQKEAERSQQMIERVVKSYQDYQAKWPKKQLTDLQRTLLARNPPSPDFVTSDAEQPIKGSFDEIRQYHLKKFQEATQRE